MKTYSNQVIEKVNHVISDANGNKDAALRHFEGLSNPEAHCLYSLFDAKDPEEEARFYSDCAEYVKSIM